MINCAEDPRVALQLSRFHSWPILRVQSNGEHSCQIMRILLTIWPDCPRKMLVHCVTHDMGEMAGDIQYPYKKKYPALKPLMDTIERDVKSVMGDTIGMPPIVALNQYEERVFKICEFIEMWEYGLHEQGLGNQYGRIIATRCIQAAGAMLNEIVEIVTFDVRPNVRKYVDARTKWEMQNDR